MEKKFKNISDEILTKRESLAWRKGMMCADELLVVDDMAERCDRLEQEMLMRDASGIDTRSKSTLKSGESTGDADA